MLLPAHKHLLLDFCTSKRALASDLRAQRHLQLIDDENGTQVDALSFVAAIMHTCVLQYAICSTLASLLRPCDSHSRQKLLPEARAPKACPYQSVPARKSDMSGVEQGSMHLEIWTQSWHANKSVRHHSWSSVCSLYKLRTSQLASDSRFGACQPCPDYTSQLSLRSFSLCNKVLHWKLRFRSGARAESQGRVHMWRLAVGFELGSIVGQHAHWILPRSPLMNRIRLCVQAY